MDWRSIFNWTNKVDWTKYATVFSCFDKEKSFLFAHIFLNKLGLSNTKHLWLLANTGVSNNVKEHY